MSLNSPPEAHWQLPGLDDLIARLQREGFPVGLSEGLDAARLLHRLAERGIPMRDRSALLPHLRPLFCKSSRDQQRFDTLFLDWAGQAPVSIWTPATSKAPQAISIEPPPQAAPRLNAWKIGLVGLIVVLTGLLAWWGYDQYRKPIPLKPIETTTNSVTLPTKPQAPTAPTQTRPQTKPLPEFAGYYPAYHTTETLRPAWAWGLVLTPLLALLLLLHRPPSRGLSRSSGGETRLDGWPRSTLLSLAVARLNPALVGRLDRHLRGPASERSRAARRPLIDVSASVAATLRRLGVPQLRYRHIRLRPSYLVLVEADQDEDIQVLWAERLRQEGIATRILRLERNEHGQALGWRPVGETSGRRLPLEHLPAPEYHQRLVYIGDGRALLQDEHTWQPWARRAQLRRWPQRALFTSREYRDWGEAEHTLGQGETADDPGFLVLPQDDNALAAWAQFLSQGDLPEILLSESDRYPPLLSQAAADYQGNTLPPTAEPVRLIAQLKHYLGENGYYWLCACAVPPLLDHRLALLLAEQLFRRRGARSQRLPYHIARNYRLLARLPWIRRPGLPDWLRLALLASLPPRIQEEIRRAVEGLLAPLRPNPQGTIKLATGIHRPAPPTVSPQPDALSLGFLHGMDARQLALRIPGPWHAWLGQLHGQTGWRARLAPLRAAFGQFWYRGGLPHQGIGRGRWWGLGLLLVAVVAFYEATSRIPPQNWPAEVRDVLFEKSSRYVVLGHHQYPVLHAAFSPNGSRIVTASEDNTAQVWDATSGQRLGTPLQHRDSVIQAAFSLDGTRIVTVSGDKTARVWDAASGRPLGTPMQHEALVNYATFSPNGTRIVTASDDKTARMWDATSGKPLGPPLQHRDTVEHAAFSPDGTRIVTASWDKTARVWDATSGQPLGQPLQHEAGVDHADFCSDGTCIITTSWFGATRLWDPATSQPLPQKKNVTHAAYSPTRPRIDSFDLIELELVALRDGPMRVAFSLEGTRVVTTRTFNTGKEKGNSDRAWVRDAATWKLIGEPLRQPDTIHRAEFSPDGTRIVTASADGTARVWDAVPSKPIGSLPHQEQVDHVVFSPDGKRFVTAGRDGTALWDTATRQRQWRNKGNPSQITFSADGTRIFTAQWDGSAQVLDAVSGQPLGPLITAPFGDKDNPYPLARLNTARAAAITSLYLRPAMRELMIGISTFPGAFSPDGSRIVIAGGRDKAQVFDTATGQPIGREFLHGGGSLLGAAYSPDGSRILTNSLVGTARVWNAATGQPLGPLLRHGKKGFLLHAAFSPDSNRLITTSEDGTAQVWAATGGQPQGPALQHKNLVYHAAFSPDGTRVVTASADGTARIWDAATGKPIGEPLQHQAAVTRAVFSPDGSRIATASNDYTARVWDAATGQPLSAPFVHDAEVTDVTFSPDGTQVATATGTTAIPNSWGSAELWPAPPQPIAPGQIRNPSFLLSLNAFTTSKAFITSSFLLLLLWLVGPVYTSGKLTRRVRRLIGLGGTKFS